MDARLRAIAADTKGFMPDAEGLALYECARTVAADGPLLEIGSYCGKSSVYLGAAARETDRLVYSIDHHRGSEEHQPGEGYSDPDLYDVDADAVDSLPCFRRTLGVTGLEDVVVAIVGRSERIAAYWRTPLALVFIDGGHSAAAVHADFDGWSPKIVHDGLLVIHDVFEDPREGGRPPFEIYERALSSGEFEEVGGTGSLRALQRIRDPLVDPDAP